MKISSVCFGGVDNGEFYDVMEGEALFFSPQQLGSVWVDRATKVEYALLNTRIPLKLLPNGTRFVDESVNVIFSIKTKIKKELMDIMYKDFMGIDLEKLEV